MPKLQVFAVDILPGLFGRASIVGRFYIKPPLDVTAFTDDVEPVIHVFTHSPLRPKRIPQRGSRAWIELARRYANTSLKKGPLFSKGRYFGGRAYLSRWLPSTNTLCF